jgi:uncharacterized protein YktA (UPF0223 family)
MFETEKFNVVQFFNDGGNSYEYVRQAVSVEEAIKAFKHYTTCVTARMGMTERVIITDMDDCVNVEWQYGKGIVFPFKEEEDIQKH